MANKPNDPKNKGDESSKKSNADDLDKTLVDVDIRALEKAVNLEKEKPKSPPKADNNLDKTQANVNLREMKVALDETLIFERPLLDDEDTDLHRLRKQKELAEKAVKKDLPQEPISPPIERKAVVKSSTPIEEKSVNTKDKAKNLWKDFTSFTALEVPPQSTFTKVVEFVCGLTLLLLLLDVCIEGLALVSPMAPLSVAVVILCVLVNIYFIIRKGNFYAGLELSTWGFLGLLGYSTWKYGSFDVGSFSLIKHSPAQIYNYVFLASLLIVLILIFQNRKNSWFGKISLSVLIFYGSAGFIENLLSGILTKRTWNLEDTLLGTELWRWIPLYYLRPVMFCFWILLPLLSLYFLFQKTQSIFKKEKIYSRESTFALGLVFLSFCLGNLILFKNHYPSLINFVLSPQKGWGETQAWNYSLGSSEDYDIEVLTANVGTEKNNDSLPIYEMGAMFVPASDAKKVINLTMREKGGEQVPFYKSTDLLVSQEDVPQKPIKLKFKEEMLLTSKSMVLLIDKSSSMSSLIPSIDKSVRALFSMMNSRESLFWAPFAETVQPVLITDLKALQKSVSTLFAQGNRNVTTAIEKALATLKGKKGDKIVLLITSADPVLEDLSGRFLSQMKSDKVKFYGVSIGGTVQESMNAFAEGSGGKWLSLKSPQNLSLAVSSIFADAFGQYQVSYEGQSFGPKFSIITPQNGDEIYKDTPLQVKIQNFQDVNLSVARLYVEGKQLQEVPVQGLQDIAFTLAPAQLPRGVHEFKVALVGEGGKEFVQAIKLSVSSESDFAFIRPLDSDVVSGQVNLEVYYKNRAQNPIQKVEFWIDGQKVGEASSEPYLYTWDSQAQTGTHSIQAIATFMDSSTKTDQIKLNVVSGFGVHITSPSVGEFLNNLTEIEADVSNNLSEVVTKLEFYVDGGLLGEVTQSPYKYLWDNSELATGRHVLQARAHTSNNWVSTDAVVVNIGNGTLSVQLEDSSSPNLAPDYIEWVVDASSSMEGDVGGISKIEMVKQALSNMLPKVPTSTQVALRSFGSESLASHHDCKDSVLNYPLKSLESQRMVSAVNAIEAQGMSPLGYTLEKIKGDFRSATGTRVVIVMTDGFDNCAGDPVGQLERWKKEKLNIKLYILGLDIEGSRSESELKRLAGIVGGTYYPVKSEKDMMSAFDEMIKVTYRVFDYKEREVAQKPIGASSVPLRTGEYRVEIDLEPPLVKDKVLINNGVEKKILLHKTENSFNYSE